MKSLITGRPAESVRPRSDAGAAGVSNGGAPPSCAWLFGTTGCQVMESRDRTTR